MSSDMEGKMQSQIEGSMHLYDEMCLEIEQLKAQLRAAKLVIGEADSYLDTNSFTNIGHGSVLHTMFKDVLAKRG